MKKYAAILMAIVFAVALSCSIATIGSVYADDSETVIYDAADFANLSGRSQGDVMEKYTEATAAGTTYLGSTQASYYDVPASTSAPYAAGVLSSDTLAAMKGMTNFYRWLIGVENLSVNTGSNASLQAQALDRNFEFDHYISNDSKPADMDDALWAEGFACNHNILAIGYNPANSVTGWLNEGYQPSKGTWDTVGHRTAILNAGYQSIAYGYSGNVAIGKCGSYGNTFTNAFAAFPAAGYMPNTLVSKSRASWTVELNTSIVKASNAAGVIITVKNLTTGESYTCKQSDGTAVISASLLNFIQPTDTTSSYYTDSYKITATGLTDVATGKNAAITYTVNFFSPNTLSSISLPQPKYAHTGSAIRPEATVKCGSDTLTKGRDYTLIYHNNVEEGTAIVEARGTGNYCGTVKRTFKIEVDRKDMSQCVISLSQSSARYTGEEIKPGVTVTSFGNTLTEGEDYEVTYRDNIYPGYGIVTVRGIGDYTGTSEKTFTINKGLNTITRNVSAYNVEVDGTATITASALENAEISFQSSDETIATVDADGTVHALSAGRVIIRIIAAETDNYSSTYVNVGMTMSTDIHTMVDTNVIYADDENGTATVTRVCSVCGKEETTSFTTMGSFSLWYWTGGSGSSAISRTKSEGDVHSISLRACSPSDAENKELVLETSDPDVMTVGNDSFSFVGAGTVTLTIKAKYRPSAKITINFTVNHVFDEGDVQRPSTCSEKGEIKYTCTKCGATTTDELAIDPDNHTGETVLKNAKNPTCAEQGYTGDICCAGCEAVLEQGEAIPIDQNAHSWGEPSYTWAEDNSAVSAVRVCTHDDSHKQTETVAATPETIKEATCTATGEVKYTSEEFGNTVFKAQTRTVATPVNPIAHGDALTHIAAKEETCTKDGNVEYWHCINCGKYFSNAAGSAEVSGDSVVIHAPGHNYVDIPNTAIAPTCQKDGKEADQECSRCQDVKTGASITKLEHVWGEPTYRWEDDHSEVTATRYCEYDTNHEHPDTETVGLANTETTDSTCSAEGVMTYTSEEFNNPAFEVQIDSVAIAKKDHTPGAAKEENVVESTCTMPGSYDSVIRCSVCGAKISSQPMSSDPLGHAIVHHEAQAPTCANVGWGAYETCSRCTYTTYTEIAPTGNHSWKTIAEKAGFLKDGQQYDQCEVCGAKQNITTLDGYANYYVKKLKVKKGKKSFTVKWKKQSKKNLKKFNGYQIRYSTKADMTDAKMVNAGKKSKSKKVKKLAKKTQYFVQVRTYTVRSGKAYYSKWSPMKKVKTK